MMADSDGPWFDGRTPSAEVRPMNATRAKGPYRVGQVAEMLGVHRDTVQSWCRDGDLAATQTPGGHYRIAASAIDAHVARLTGAPVHQRAA
jgi:excisionase family DNA binding protein